MVQPVGFRRLPLAFLAFLLSLGAASLTAQSPHVVETYGVDSPSVAVVSAWDMVTEQSSATWSSVEFNTYRYLTSAGALYGTLHLPQGASLLAIELDACDSSAAKGVNASFSRVSASGFQQLASVLTGDAPTPGCSRFSASLTPGPATVNNYLYSYLVAVQNGSLDGTTTIGAVRVIYKLQVSPAPGAATFGDVPTSDPAFQFVEALVASGVTAGCGGGNYCPDSPLTRRQMAVFLSKVLGLQWQELPAP